MTTFRYQALEIGGRAVTGVIDAEDRKQALRLLGERGLFPSDLNIDTGKAKPSRSAIDAPKMAAVPDTDAAGFRIGPAIRRKEITAFTREMATLMQATIPIPSALEGLSEEEENPALRKLVREIAEAVRTGSSLSAALSQHPAYFSNLYTSMIRVGEEAGLLDKVLTDLATLLEHEDEVRGEVAGAIAYPMFVMVFGFVTVLILLTFVLPRLFSMLEEMTTTLPPATRILLAGSNFFKGNWWWLFPLAGVALVGLYKYSKTDAGAEKWDKWKLKIPALGPVFFSAALGRFARTLGTLLRAGVSLLPALKIVEDTIGNRTLGAIIAQVAEETRGGDSLAGPLRKMGVFPRTVTQMIRVGEETGQLDEMLLQVANIEERRTRAHTKTLISLLAPALILVVGLVVAFIVVAILLPIMRMSQSMH
jgi:type II secretory pathway component PulF